MGIQIYIKTKRLKEKNIVMIESSSTFTDSYFCKCGKHREKKCDKCGTSGKSYTEYYVDVQGIPFLMNKLDDDTIYHDANRWGSSRKHLLEFIEKHQLNAGEDWYDG